VIRSPDLPSDVRRQSFERINSAAAKWPLFNFREMWRYRAMISYLTTRDIRARYKQTVVGIAWTVINPFITMVLFTFVFGELAQVPSYNVPYPVFAFAALVPWTFFSRTLTLMSSSLVANQALVTKVYFPRMIIPLAAMLTCLVDFGIAFVMLLVLMLIYGITPALGSVIWLPFFLLLTLAFAVGIGLWFSAMNVRVRDVNYVVPYLLQALQYLSPIAYSSSLIEGPLRPLYFLNPLAAVADGFRWTLLGIPTFDPSDPAMILLPVLSALFFLSTGYAFFRRMEPSFADVI
jgi:lipopolysaccharide transport system permease protein